ncbi:hypothetical protein K491DRAFT_721991 [Lophiostoma macrostomum CBS 122681]|uniref:Uncharacterized protein n=1 Tax=Lophiostoma macrostomum CBS 122681 TaxID=1314788 RepID=A0A6A6SNK9_9PLEO|nr:hypothetical protein K491DRAFT_721991 [Lophiostoma macrostomum CBS 122681]
MLIPPTHLPTDMSSEIPLHMAEDILDLMPPEHYPSDLPARPSKSSYLYRLLHNRFFQIGSAIIFTLALVAGAAGLGMYIGKTHNLVTPAQVTSTITPDVSTTSATKTIWLKPLTNTHWEVTTVSATQWVTTTISASAMPSQTEKCEGKVTCNPNTGGPSD